MFIARKEQRKKAQNRGTVVFLSAMITIAALFNVFVFFLNSSFSEKKNYLSALQKIAPKKPNITSKRAAATDAHDGIRSNDFDDKFTEQQLDDAIKGLHLPTWSRRYVDCRHPKSEVTCSQIVHAWRLLNSWTESQKGNFSEHKHFIIQHLYDGVGNRMSTETASFVIALMDNRTYTVEAQHPSSNPRTAFGQAFDFHPAVTYRFGNNSQIDEYFSKNLQRGFCVQTFDLWYSYNYDDLLPKNQLVYINILLFATMPYANYGLSDFCIKHFGIHATYFICNFLMYLPNIAMEQATKAVEAVPKNVRLFGVHLRFQEPNHFFAYNVTDTISKAEGFLTAQYKRKPTVFALATDSGQIENTFKSLFPDTISTNALRIPDADHLSALYDIALLEYCDDLLLTYRSTFSCIVMARTARKAWFVEKECPGVFDISNSQASMISAIYHQYDVNDWQTNRRFRLVPEGEKAFRYYFYNFLL